MQDNDPMREFISTHISMPLSTYIKSHPNDQFTPEMITDFIYEQTPVDKMPKLNIKSTVKSTVKPTVKPKVNNKRKPCKWVQNGKKCTKTTSNISGFCSNCSRSKAVKDIIDNERRAREQEISYKQSEIEKQQDITNNGGTNELNVDLNNAISKQDDIVPNQSNILEEFKIRLLDPTVRIYEDLDTHAVLKYADETYIVIGKLVDNVIVKLDKKYIKEYTKHNIHYKEDLSIKLILEKNVSEPSPLPDL